jgi:hypothetical protein
MCIYIPTVYTPSGILLIYLSSEYELIKTFTMKFPTQDQMIEEFNELHIQVSGQGISPSFRDELRNHGCDTVLNLLNEKKHLVAHAIYRGIEEDEDAMAFDSYMTEQPERCDSIDHN